MPEVLAEDEGLAMTDLFMFASPIIAAILGATVGYRLGRLKAERFVRSADRYIATLERQIHRYEAKALEDGA